MTYHTFEWGQAEVVTNLGNLTAGAVDDSDEALISRCFLD